MKTTDIKERETYNALIGLTDPSPEQSAYALLKVCYHITSEGLRRTSPEPFLHDINDESLSPRLVAGTDYFPFKRATDVVVQGKAFCDRPVTVKDVGVSVGNSKKTIRVFGRRGIRSSHGRVVIDSPEPFREMPLTYENAYGGIDTRIEKPHDPQAMWMVDCDHPGLYPRNPFGKGYLACPGEIPKSAEMPNLENPLDLLTEDRLVISDPTQWWRQPLPDCFDWMHVMSFPRYVYMGADAWFEGPEDEQLPEVRLGHLPRNYRSDLEAFEDRLGFFQEASLGMTMDNLSAGCPVRLLGMHPEKESLEFLVPNDPVIRINLEGNEEQVPVRIHHIVCHPTEEKVYFLYGASRTLHRIFIPGIHKKIPISITVDGDAPIRFEAPETVKSALNEALHRRGS